MFANEGKRKEKKSTKKPGKIQETSLKFNLIFKVIFPKAQKKKSRKGKFAGFSKLDNNIFSLSK